MSRRIIPRQRPCSQARISSRLLALLFIPLCLQVAHCPEAQARDRRTSPAQPPLWQQSTQEDTRLEPGIPVERELSGGQRHVYRIELTKGQYIRLEIRQHDISVGVTIHPPEGKAVFAVEPIGVVQEPVVNRVAESSGIYRLDVYARAKAPTGRYEIRLAELRAATEDDLALQRARESFEESILLHREGRYNEARPLLLGALKIRERVMGADSRGVGQVLRLLASNYQNTGEYPSAEPLLWRSLKIIEQLQGPEHLETAHELRSLGIYYHRMGDQLRAEELVQKALGIFEKTDRAESFNIPTALDNLGDIYYERGDYGNAGGYYRRAHAVWSKLAATNHYHLAGSFARLGRAAYAAGDYAEAEASFARALDLTEKTFGPEHPQATSALADLAMLYSTTGEYEKAEALYGRALAIHEQKTALSHPHAQTVLFGMARLRAARGRAREAAELQTRASELEERHVELNIAVGSEHERLTYLAGLSARASRNVSLHTALAPGDPAALELAVATVLRRKGRVQDALAENLAALRSRSGPEDQALLDELNGTTSRLARLILGGPQHETPAEHQNKVKALAEQRGRLEAEIGRRSAGFYEGARPVTLAAVQAAIPAGAALVEFAAYRPFDPKAPDNEKAYGEPRYVAYVIPRAGEVRWAELGEARAVDDAVGALRRALRDPRRRDARELSRALDEKLMRPVRALLGDVTRLLVSPDGQLNLIPFEALADERGRYLVERYAFSYLTSGRDLLRLQTRRESKGPPVVLADPAFGEPAVVAARAGAGGRVQIDYSRVFFGPLPGVGEEVRALKGLLPQASFLTGERATEAALKRVSAPPILHVATHGFFLQGDDQAGAPASARTKDAARLGKWVARVENPLLRSGLALAGANQGRSGEDDGLLTALEATALDLWGTRLVVLSACDTGLGEVKNGDGVYGLRRALVLAGAESQLMSLWPVSDRSTRDLMVEYYKGLVQNAGRSEALRRVQLRMLRDKSHGHPYYWASFILTGEWANLRGER